MGATAGVTAGVTGTVMGCNSTDGCGAVTATVFAAASVPSALASWARAEREARARLSVMHARRCLDGGFTV
jgi:hypothetical protein